VRFFCEEEYNERKMARRTGVNLDVGLCIFATKRFLARIGLFQCTVSFLSESYIVQSDNIFKNCESGLLCRFTIKIQIAFKFKYFGILALISRYTTGWPKFTVSKDRNDAIRASRCWAAACSSFHIRVAENKCCLTCNSTETTKFNSIPGLGTSWYFDDHILEEENGSICLILPWFDRPDRMIFSRYLGELYNSCYTKLRSSLSKIAIKLLIGFKPTTYSGNFKCNQFVELIIHIHQYL
jgi:hypothetical protein